MFRPGLFKQLWSHLPYIAAAIVLLLLSVINPVSRKHVLFNLEPYPDGLFYTLSAISISQGKGPTLHFNDTVLVPKIPPAYSFFLAPFYAVLHSPISFYSANVLISLITVLFLYLALLNSTEDKTLQLVSLLLYVLHGYVTWFITLPMAENLGLFLTSMLVWLITKNRMTPVSVILGIVASFLLVFTKYVYFPIALIYILFIVINLIKKRNKRVYGSFLCSAVVCSLFFATFLWYIDFNPLSAFGSQTDKPNTPTFFYSSLLHSSQSISTYLQMLLGQESSVLWLTYPLSSFGILASCVVMITWLKLKKQPLPKNLFYIVGLAFSPLLLLQFFYVIDGRYLLTAIPCLIVLFALLANHLKNSVSKKMLVFSFVLLIVSHIYSQSQLVKMIVANNLLQRSTAWQYEAVQHLSASLNTQDDAVLITALPPYLFSYYSGHENLLPLSDNQEFANKQQHVWGDEIEYKNLPGYFETLIKQGKRVYISNTYISHSREVAEDYQDLTLRFNFLPVTAGCLETCNLFLLELRPGL